MLIMTSRGRKGLSIGWPTIILATVTLLTLTPIPARATHDNWYFVWHEDDYVQGTWKRAEMLHRSTKVLRPMMYVDLIGSESLDLVQNVMERLRAHRPEMYGFKYSAT
ncbi:MAG: hypothetical protein AB7H80_17750, partial [Candidatus Kapaibacterium sp.]